MSPAIADSPPWERATLIMLVVISLGQSFSPGKCQRANSQGKMQYDLDTWAATFTSPAAPPVVGYVS